jgi:hypothetical protein
MASQERNWTRIEGIWADYQNIVEASVVLGRKNESMSLIIPKERIINAAML